MVICKSYSTISLHHKIKVIPGGACANGICTGGSQDTSFRYSVVSTIAWWCSSSSPFNNTFYYGQSFQGYYPSDHPAFGSHASYYQRPVLHHKEK